MSGRTLERVKVGLKRRVLLGTAYGLVAAVVMSCRGVLLGQSNDFEPHVFAVAITVGAIVGGIMPIISQLGSRGLAWRYAAWAGVMAAIFLVLGWPVAIMERNWNVLWLLPLLGASIGLAICFMARYFDL